MPLATAVVIPGTGSMSFESTVLAEYVMRRVRESLPLLFLLKVADAQEDTPGSMITVYSGNHGDSRNIHRRPCLELEWSAPSESAAISRQILLERGRTLFLPAINLKAPALLAASFIPDSSSLDPTLQIRTGTGNDTTAWRPIHGLAECERGWAQIRILAAQDPVILGEPYHAEMRDTWITTAAPEEQEVPWIFISPTGARHETMAKYAGDSRWAVDFVPDEIGLWRVSWSQSFAEHPYQSETAFFDVMLGDLDDVRSPLHRLAEEARKANHEDKTKMTPLMGRFARLERAAMARLTPDQFRSTAGESLRTWLNEARQALGREAVPDSIPMVPDHPPKWVKK
jgi:hypothetical protein